MLDLYHRFVEFLMITYSVPANSHFLKTGLSSSCQDEYEAGDLLL